MYRILLVALVSGGVVSAADAPTFFDGKTLAGWEGIPQYWQANNGAIVGTTPGDGLKFNTFLCSTKKYRDFELSFQVRLRGGTGNSGVQIRSELLDLKHFEMKGPQCDIGVGYWGDLYGENMGGLMQAAPKDKVKTAVKLADFNDYHIRCVKQHVTITINGTTMVDGDFPKMPAEGIIGFQLHSGGATEVTFRKIEFREMK